jgi:hypothetical protein
MKDLIFILSIFIQLWFCYVYLPGKRLVPYSICLGVALLTFTIKMPTPEMSLELAFTVFNVQCLALSTKEFISYIRRKKS